MEENKELLELLQKVDHGEAMIRQYLPATIPLRLRVKEDLARIEVPEGAMEIILRHRQEIISGLQKSGFRFITLDLQGFRSGCYDKPQA